jgi:hypothetical protein
VTRMGWAWSDGSTSFIMEHDVESPVRGDAGRVAPGASSPDPYPVSRSFWTMNGSLFASTCEKVLQ